MIRPGRVRHPGAAVALAALLLVSSCATPRPAATPAPPAGGRTTVCLLPQRDGAVGAIVVSNPQGSIDLTLANQAVAVAVTSEPPGPARILAEEEISSLFGPALGSLPPAPSIYILYFDSGSVDLKGESLALLDRVVADIGARIGADVSIVGHTDTKGDRRLNDELSLRRAHGVADLLSARGVDTGGFEISSHGKDQPLVPTGDQADEPRNRRVEITVR